MDKFETSLDGASIACSVLANDDVSDIELVPLLPRVPSRMETEHLVINLAGRGLRFIGVVAIVHGKPVSVLEEPLDAVRIAALSQAFLAHVEALLSGAIEEQQPRRDPEYDWVKRRYV